MNKESGYYVHPDHTRTPRIGARVWFKIEPTQFRPDEYFDKIYVHCRVPGMVRTRPHPIYGYDSRICFRVDPELEDMNPHAPARREVQADRIGGGGEVHAHTFIEARYEAKTLVARFLNQELAARRDPTFRYAKITVIKTEVHKESGMGTCTLAVDDGESGPVVMKFLLSPPYDDDANLKRCDEGKDDPLEYVGRRLHAHVRETAKDAILNAVLYNL